MYLALANVMKMNLKNSHYCDINFSSTIIIDEATIKKSKKTERFRTASRLKTKDYVEH